MELKKSISITHDFIKDKIEEFKKKGGEIKKLTSEYEPSSRILNKLRQDFQQINLKGL